MGYERKSLKSGRKANQPIISIYPRYPKPKHSEGDMAALKEDRVNKEFQQHMSQGLVDLIPQVIYFSIYEYEPIRHPFYDQPVY